MRINFLGVIFTAESLRLYAPICYRFVTDSKNGGYRISYNRMIVDTAVVGTLMPLMLVLPYFSL